MSIQATPVHPRGGGRATLFWVAIPVAIHLAILARFWFDAPVLDDYDCILASLNAMARADGPLEWLRHVFALQNEHRLAVTRLAARIAAWNPGGIDFRMLMLLGTLAMLGTLAFILLEFREKATGAIAGAAAFLLLQWSYNEALLMASAATAHLAVVFFAFAGLYFALRPGRVSAALCIAGGVLASYSQANGLFVLPLAGVACFLVGKRRRGALFLAAGALLWVVYFIGYGSGGNNPHHPSPLVALQEPIATLQLFLIIIGGVVPSLSLAQLYGAAIVSALGWVAWKGFWREHPTVFLWIAFVLVSAGTVAVARVGFGLFHGSRYAVNAALLLAILALAIHSLTQPWRRGLDRAVLAAAAVVWAAIALVALTEIRERSLRGRMLVAIEPADALGVGRYAGVHHVNKGHAARILAVAEHHGWYTPQRQPVSRGEPVIAASRPPKLHAAGSLDEVSARGRTVVVRGWTDIPATVAGRTFGVHPAIGINELRVEGVHPREDVVMSVRRPDLLLSGFRLVVEYPSEEAATKGAERLCVIVEAPGVQPRQVARNGTACD